MKLSIPLSLLVLGVPALLAYGWLHTEATPGLAAAPGEGIHDATPQSSPSQDAAHTRLSPGTDAARNPGATAGVDGSSGFEHAELENAEPGLADFAPAGLSRGSDEPGEADYLRAQERMKAGDWDAAIMSLDSAVAAAPNKYDAWADLAYAHLERGASDDLELALEACRRAIDLEPNRVEGWYNRACAHARMANPEGAMEALSRALELDPQRVKESARTDDDLDAIRSEPGFERILNSGADPIDR